MMNVNDTITLCQTFKRKVSGVTYYAYAKEVATPGVCVDYQGRPYWGTTKTVSVVYCKTNGPATVPPPRVSTVFEIEASSPERVEAHWNSFLANHSAAAPEITKRVNISNGPGRHYTGRAVRNTKTRVLVAYRFANGRKAAPKWFKLSEVSW